MKKPSGSSGELKKHRLRSGSLFSRLSGSATGLVRAAREQCHQNHQIRQGEKPLIRLDSRRFRGTRDEPQMAALREIVQVVDANPREGSHLGIGEYFLARFNGNHGPWPSFLLRPTWPYPLDAGLILRAALCKSNRSSVSYAKNDSASTLCLKPQENAPFLRMQKRALELVPARIKFTER
jgi:hypothetical protein